MNSRILTFYSWKGGVGRTMALANVGVQLARKGKRVLMVDWDLEAPGLEKYFSHNSQQGAFLISITNASDNTGLLGLLDNAMKDPVSTNKPEEWKYRCSRITLIPHTESSFAERAASAIEIDFLGSGQESTDYSVRLDLFSWASFFSDHEGAKWLEELRRQWKKEYDYILIDSRTGLTDAGGVCTVQMPDMLVLAFTANTQSLEGGLRFLKGLNEARDSFPYERTRLTVFPLLSRWEGAKEVDLSEQWLERIENLISPLVETWLPINLPPRRLLERLRVPHVARFSFGEPLPVLTHSLTDPDLPGLAYDLLADLISGPLSAAGPIIEPGYQPPLDIENISTIQMDELIQDQQSVQKEIANLNKIYGPNSQELVRFLQKLATRALNQKELIHADSFANEAVAAAQKRLSCTDPGQPVTNDLYQSLVLLAEISQRQENLTKAAEAFQEALKILCKRQEMDPLVYKWNKEISITHGKIADIQRKLGKHDIALTAYQQAIATSQTMKDGQLDPVWQQELREIKEKLGGLFLEIEKPSEALSCYRDLLSERGLAADGKDFSIILTKVGKILRELGNAAEALVAYKDALMSRMKMTREPLDHAMRRDLSNIYEEIGDLSLEQNMPSDALEAYRQSFVIRTSLSEGDLSDATKQRDFNVIREKYEQLLNGQVNGQGIGLAERVPIEYRSQAPGRGQRQYIKKPKDAPQGWRSPMEQWLDEWVDRVGSRTPFSSEGLKISEVQIDWRLLSNSGLDDGIIRPVTGAGGWPLIPGSSVKGLFRRACRKHAPDRLMRWCGGVVSTGEETTLQPGLLRFHGAWPADDKWKDNLLDVVHPQQEWQVGMSFGKQRGARGVVSLYRPKLQIGLSCAAPVGSKDHFNDKEWEDIFATLRAALVMGIGGRTCAGYGSSGPVKGDLLFECAMAGQGPAAKLLDGTPEFRPTMFRAAIRGMALRLFGGVTDAPTARQVVGRLFGSISPDDDKAVNVGLLATAYTDATPDLGSFGWSNYRQPTYATSGRLQWLLTRRCGTGEDEALLTELLRALHGLTMSLGGFGRGWRRPDHRIFYPGYDKTPIGCHWEWRDVPSLHPLIHVQSPKALAHLLQTSRRLARRWLDATGQASGGPAPWREVIHPTRMKIWVREAKGPRDAVAVAWFHKEMAVDKGSGEPTDPCNLKGSDLAGRMKQVGLIWNRLLPLLAPGHESPVAKAAQPANPLARPANPTARPANPMSRPTGMARGRPSAARQPARQSQGDVSIAAHQGAYLESLVLHAPPQGAPPEAREHHQRFIAEMNRGARANFEPVDWS